MSDNEVELDDIDSSNVQNSSMTSSRVIPIFKKSSTKISNFTSATLPKRLRKMGSSISKGGRAATLPRLKNGIWGTRTIQNMRNCCKKKNDDDDDDDDDEVDKSKNFRPRKQPTSTKRKFAIGIYTICLVFGLLVFTYFDYYSTTDIGSPSPLTCDAKFWKNGSRFDSSCGVQGESCLPFINTSKPIRCPRWCDFGDEVLYGSDIYTATSSICYAAKHANLYSQFFGGCFGVRVLGEQTSFNSSHKNGITSLSNSWFPLSFEFYEIETGYCDSYRPFIDLYVFVTLVILVLFFVPRKALVFILMIVIGWIYLATNTTGVDLYSYLILLNDSFTNVMIALLISHSLWKFSIRQTMPSVKKFPLDFLIFYLVPFWAGIRMDTLISLGFNLSLSSEIFRAPEYIVGFVLFVGIAIPVVILQCRMYIVEGGMSARGIKVLIFVGALLVLALTLSSFFSLHVHHFFVGIIGSFFFRGQPKWRYSIIFQAICLGVFVNGIIVWGLAPFFDESVTVTSAFDATDPQYLLWTNISTTSSSITLEWTTFGQLDQYHKCYAVGRRLDNDNNNNNDDDQDKVEETLVPYHGARRSLVEVEKAANTFKSRRGLSVLSVDPDSDALPWKISLNSVLMYQGQFDISDDGFSFSYTIENLPQNVPFYLMVGRPGSIDTTLLQFSLDQVSRPLWIPSGENAEGYSWYCDRLYDLNVF